MENSIGLVVTVILSFKKNKFPTAYSYNKQPQLSKREEGYLSFFIFIFSGVAGVPGMAVDKMNSNKNPLFLIEEEKRESAAKLSNMEREMEEVNIRDRTIENKVSSPPPLSKS